MRSGDDSFDRNFSNFYLYSFYLFIYWKNEFWETLKFADDLLDFGKNVELAAGLNVALVVYAWISNLLVCFSISGDANSTLAL